MFLIKKPKWLEFVSTEYDPIVHKAARKQVRYMGNVSNAKLVKFKDNNYFLKVGDDMHQLRMVQMPVNFVIYEKSEGKYVKKGVVSEKCFVSETKS